MQHITFARFADSNQAEVTVRALRERPAGDAEVLAHFGATSDTEFEQVVQHSGEFAQTDLRHALVVGSITGTLSGAALGIVLSLFDLLPSIALGMGLGALMGFLVGLVMMPILGSGLMDRRLQRLVKGLRAGEVVLTVRTTNRAACTSVNELLTEHGAQIAEKGML